MAPGLVNGGYDGHRTYDMPGRQKPGWVCKLPTCTQGMKANAGLYPFRFELANSDLGQATGRPYHYVLLNGISDNQAALAQAEQAVDSGQPVRISVTNGGPTRRQMVIIGSSGGKLEITNLWEYGRTPSWRAWT
jgi:hypothetical protein